MKVLAMMIVAALVVDAAPSSEMEMRYLICRQASNRCSVWKLSQVGKAGTLAILHHALHRHLFCGYAEEITPLPALMVKSLDNKRRLMGCTDYDYQNGYTFDINLTGPVIVEEMQQHRMNIQKRREKMQATQ